MFNYLNRRLSQFLVKTYEHVPNTVLFSSNVDNFIIFREDYSDLFSIFNDDKVLFYDDKMEIYLRKKYEFTYFDIIKWTIDKQKCMFIIHTIDQRFSILFENEESLDEFHGNLDIKIKNILHRYYNIIEQ